MRKLTIQLTDKTIDRLKGIQRAFNQDTKPGERQATLELTASALMDVMIKWMGKKDVANPTLENMKDIEDVKRILDERKG